MSDSTPLVYFCSYCGKPIRGSYVFLNERQYHADCAPVGGNKDRVDFVGLLWRVQELERRVRELEGER